MHNYTELTNAYFINFFNKKNELVLKLIWGLVIDDDSRASGHILTGCVKKIITDELVETEDGTYKIDKNTDYINLPATDPVFHELENGTSPLEIEGKLRINYQNFDTEESYMHFDTALDSGWLITFRDSRGNLISKHLYSLLKKEDKSGRFKVPGRVIFTSKIKEIIDDYVMTSNSVYKIDIANTDEIDLPYSGFVVAALEQGFSPVFILKMIKENEFH